MFDDCHGEYKDLGLVCEGDKSGTSFNAQFTSVIQVNGQETNRYNNNSIVSERTMREIYLRGFEIAVRESQPAAVMTSYNLLNGEHTSQRKDLVDDILRCEFGFQGFVMTDWITTGKMYDPSSKHPGIFAHKVIAAGNDIIMPGAEPDFADLMRSLADGTLDREKLMICASRIYRMILYYA
jgi:beta-glucosidase